MLQVLADILTDYKFLLGLFLSLPLAITANILTPKFEKFLSQRNQKIPRRRLEKIKKEFSQIKDYTENRTLLTEYLLVVLIKSIALGFLIIFWAQFFEFLRVSPFSTLFILLGSIAIANWNLDALKVYSNVKNFDEYEKKRNENLIQINFCYGTTLSS